MCAEKRRDRSGAAPELAASDSIDTAASKIAMTFFPDQFAKTMKVEALTLQELADRVVGATKKKKRTCRL